MTTRIPPWLAKLMEATVNNKPLYWVTDLTSETGTFAVSQIAMMSNQKKAEEHTCQACGAISSFGGEHFFSTLAMHQQDGIQFPEALCMGCLNGIMGPIASFPSYITDFDPVATPVWNSDYHFRINLNADLAMIDHARALTWQILADMEEELNNRVAEALQAEALQADRQQAEEAAELGIDLGHG